MTTQSCNSRVREIEMKVETGGFQEYQACLAKGWPKRDPTSNKRAGGI